MKRMSKVLFCLLLLVFSFAPVCHGAEETSQNFKTVPIAQWEKLKANNKLLSANLQMLLMNLMALENPTKELLELSKKCQLDLISSQEQLQNANASLKTAQDLLEKTKQSYAELESKYEAERKEAQRLQREAYRKGWLNGFSIGFSLLITDKIIQEIGG